MRMIESFFYYKFMGTDFYHIAYSFFLYGFACWLMECIFEAFRTKKFTNRGFNKGPICTIYGVAFLFMYFPMKPFIGKWVLMYVLGAVVATILEYVTGIVLEKTIHQRLWDYSDFPLNFQGRICLFISLAWGALVVLVLGIVQPRVEMLIDMIPKPLGFRVLNVLIWIYFIDLAFSIASRSKFGEGVKEKFDDKKEKIKIRFRGGDAR